MSEKEHGFRPTFLSSLVPSCVLSCRTLSGLISTPLHFSSHLFSCLKLISSSLVLSCLTLSCRPRLVASRLVLPCCLALSLLPCFISSRLVSSRFWFVLAYLVSSCRLVSCLVSYCLVSSLMTTGTVSWLAGYKSQHRMNRKPSKRSESLHGVNKRRNYKLAGHH